VDTSLEVSTACHYHFPPTLLLNVLAQIAAFLGVFLKKKKLLVQQEAKRTKVTELEIIRLSF
jgi:hypothetical protein